MNERIIPAYAGALFVAAALLLGGSSSQGIVGGAAIELAAVAGIAFAILTWDRRWTGLQRALGWLAIAAIGVVLVQLVPLPPVLWQALPGRALLQHSLNLVGAGGSWRPISLIPAATLAAGLALLPPIAAGLIGLRAPRAGLVAIGWTVAAVMLASVAVGLGQRAAGAGSALYFYAVSNRTEAVGFFANANHFGSFCVVAAPLITALFVSRRGATRPSQRWVVMAALLAVAIGGAVLSRSFAALGLTLPALVAVFGIARLRRAPAPLGRTTMLALLGTAAVAVAAAGLLAWLDLREGPSAIAPGMGRGALWPTTVGAALRLLPFGGGLGSYVGVYPAFEDPQTVTNIFANHAHNDLIELLMDTGLLGLALVVAFGWWWVRCATAIVRAPERDAFREAAIAVTGILLLHKLVDYPLRTPALAVLFGLCCGIMARGGAEPLPEDQPVREGRHLEA